MINLEIYVYSIILLLCILLLPQVSVLIDSSNIIVPNDYSDIQSAIDNAVDGDVITVLDGEYSGFTVSKNVTIIGSSVDKVVVKGSVTINANGVHIGSLRIVFENPSSGLNSAVTIFGKNIVLSNLIIESNASGVQIGNMNYMDSNVVIEYSTIVSGKTQMSPKPAAVWGVCRSLTLYSSNIYAVYGSGVVACEESSIFFSNISAQHTGLLIDSGVVKKSKISSTGSDAVKLSGSNVLLENNDIEGVIGVNIYDKGVDSNELRYNVIKGSTIGVQIVGDYNTVLNNSISGNHAIELYGDFNKILYNNLTGGRGVHALNGHWNTISYNVIFKTGAVGIYMSSSTSNNTIYGNTFWYCYNYNAADESGFNQWYLENETHRLGNYWYDHTEPDSNSDGIVDTPYNIPTTTGKSIIDKYPLTTPIIDPFKIVIPNTSTTTFIESQTTTPFTTISTTHTSTASETEGTTIVNTTFYIIIFIVLLVIIILILYFISIKKS